MRTLRIVMPVIVAAFMLLAVAQDASAQKKKAAPPKPPAATEQTASAPSPMPPRMGNSLKDLLMKFKGELTTLGVLKQVEVDYFSVEDEGTLVIYPMSMIRSIKVVKPAESSEEEQQEEQEPTPKLEIHLQ